LHLAQQAKYLVQPTAVGGMSPCFTCSLLPYLITHEV